MSIPSRTRVFDACVHCGRAYRRVVPAVYCIGCGEPRAHRPAGPATGAAPLVDPWFSTQETEAPPRSATPKPATPHDGYVARPRVAAHLKRRPGSRPRLSLVTRQQAASEPTAIATPADPPAPPGPDLVLTPSVAAPLPEELLVESGLRTSAAGLATRLGVLGALMGAAVALLF